MRLFDGSDVTEHATVVVADGKIREVIRGERAITTPAGATVVDGRGKTLLPGLIDAHTHTQSSSDNLERALVFGVTTELEMFGDAGAARSLREAHARGEHLEQADLFSSGILVTKAGGHGTEYGFPIPTLTDAASAAAFVDARLAEGADYIKIVYDDGKAYGRTIPTLTRDELAAVVAATHKKGKLAVVHIGSLAGAKDALAVGADGLMHLFLDAPPDAEVVRLAASHKAFVVPTLAINAVLAGEGRGAALAADPRFAPFVDEAAAGQLARSFPMPPGKLRYAYAEETVRALEHAGVRILVGTDASNPGVEHGASVHDELARLVAAGLPPKLALAGCTSLAAASFGVGDRGHIAPGARADLLLVDGDPTRDISATRSIAGVWLAGVAAPRDAWHKRVERERATVAAERAVPAPKGSERGLVSDFDGESTTAAFGAGWSISTDGIAGGTSRAAMHLVAGGASGTRGALAVDGETHADSRFPWAGVAFYPGASAFAPVNLSSKHTLEFWARGDGGTYRVMWFSKRRGAFAAVVPFVADKEWRRYEFPLSRFDGTDGRDVTGILFVAGPTARNFQFALDQVSFR